MLSPGPHEPPAFAWRTGATTLDRCNRMIGALSGELAVSFCNHEFRSVQQHIKASAPVALGLIRSV